MSSVSFDNHLSTRRQKPSAAITTISFDSLILGRSLTRVFSSASESMVGYSFGELFFFTTSFHKLTSTLLETNSLPLRALLPRLESLQAPKAVLANPGPPLPLLQEVPRLPSADKMPPTEPPRQRTPVLLAQEQLGPGVVRAPC